MSTLKPIVKLFQNGSVCVVGMRGKGKDMLFANVVQRRKKAYVSNTNYGGDYIPFSTDAISCGGNNYNNFIKGNINPYSCPYPDGTDIYIADVGVYFPAQYCSELNRFYPNVPTYCALSRHISLSNVHVNCQNLNRIWDKLREQSETYIYCRFCKVLFGKLVIQKVTLYDQYEACVKRVKPFSLRPPFLASKEVRQQFKLEKERYEQQHGIVKNKWLFYINRSNYDTRVFKTLLEEGKNHE